MMTVNYRKRLALMFASLFCLLSLTACSYLFIGEFSGTFTKSDRQIVGFITYGTGEKPHERGRISIGSLEKEECRGSFNLASKGYRVFGQALKDTIYKGDLYCLDGRLGKFEYVSRKPKADGETGMLTGQIDNQPFQIEIKEYGPRDCYVNLCKYGATWKYDASLGPKWEKARKLAEGKIELKANAS